MAATDLRSKTQFVFDDQLFIAGMERFEMRLPDDDELIAGIEVTQELLGFDIADIDVIKRLHVRTGVTAWVTGDPVDGFYITIPVTPEGETAIRTGNFLPADPADEHVCTPGSACGGIYVGVYAGKSTATRRNIMMAAATVRVEAFGPVACFARGASEDGIRTMHSLGYKPIEGGLPNLFVQEGFATEEQAA